MSLNKQIKAICFDYDGTLVDYSAKMSELTKKCLRLLKNNGYILCLVTGRRGSLACKSISQYIEPEVFDYVFGFNGSETYDLKTKESVFTDLFDKQTLLDLAKMLDDPDLMLLLYDEGYALANHFLDQEFMEGWVGTRAYKPTLIKSSNDIKHGYPKYAGVFRKENKAHIDELVAKIDDPRVDFCYSAPTVLEVIPHGLTKKLAIDKLINLTGFNKDEIMAIGDNENDLGMLEACVGVVMENGIDALKEKFPIHANDVREDGIYGFFKKEGFINE